jgi:6-phosphogluconolactonase (cycloisomerase 2 family)
VYRWRPVLPSRAPSFNAESNAAAPRRPQMTNHQRFMAVVNHNRGELLVYAIRHKQRAIDALDAQKMDQIITYIVYDAADLNAAVRHVKNIYPNHYYTESGPAH